MGVVKNEPVFSSGDDDYSAPRHIIVEGTYEEIGYDLGLLARQHYDCKLGVYDEPCYAQARKEYFECNWPQMSQRCRGVLRAFDLTQDDVVHDPSALPFDWYDATRGKDLGANTCSAAVLPIEKSAGATYVSRNFDLMAMVLWSELFGKQPPEGARNAWERGIVLETRPKGGYKSLLIGGQELLIPYIDGLNEKGLYISLFHDPWGVGDEANPASGMSMSGVSMVQLVGLLLDNCTTVEEAKLRILNNHIMHVVMCAHMIIADATGNATIFEIDKHSQSYVFTDRQANEPLFITNHPVSLYPEPSTYPEFNAEAEHNSFQRQIILRDAYAKLSPPFVIDDVKALTDSVHCAFIDDAKAEAGPKERTLMNTMADLSKPEIQVRWYLGDIGPIQGTNHIEDRMSDFYRFGF